MQVGETLRIRYNPADPRAGAQLDGFMSVWQFPVFFGFLGIVLVWSGVS